MDRVGDAVSKELKRFGPAAGMAPIVEAWPAAVGMQIARNAWPARLARDGTLHVNAKDSIWAFELKSRAEEIRDRLGEHAPRRLAFAPGPIPEPAETAPDEAPVRVAEPTPEQLARADSLTRQIDDEELRKVVTKAVALSLAKGV
jgi:predicted nucleic acid-binding Zn ribbon protein